MAQELHHSLIWFVSPNAAALLKLGDRMKPGNETAVGRIVPRLVCNIGMMPVKTLCPIDCASPGGECALLLTC